MEHLIFNFKTDILAVSIPAKLNNPFNTIIPKIGRIASQEFQDYIMEASKDWDYNFDTQKGKMFGILVVQKDDNSIGYLGTVSGKLPGKTVYDKFVPAVFDERTHDFFLSKGLTTLTAMSAQILKSEEHKEIVGLVEKRKQSSIALQKRLFEHTKFLNSRGEIKSVLEIFETAKQAYPPAAAGECAAPKLLQYAFQQKLKPVAIAEFWWGNIAKNKEREHKSFYPACKNKCKPILEFMLTDQTLFTQAQL